MSIFMKIVVKLFLVAAVLVMCGNAASAQKFGTINVQELLMAMPDRDSAIVKLQKFEEELGSQMEAMQVELNTKYLDYQKTQDSLTPTMRQLKEKELEDYQRRMQEFQQMAQQDYSKMQQDLMTPVINKAQESIKKVGKAQGLTFVFDVSSGSVIYQDEATVIDILPMVKQDLGI